MSAIKLSSVSVVSAILFVASALAMPLVAQADPFGVRLTYDDDPATTVGVGWNSDQSNDDQIIYGTSPSSLDQAATARAIADRGDDLERVFSAGLTGLLPDTNYYYRVGGNNNSYYPPPGDDPFFFSTMPSDPCDSFRFVVIGDNRADINESVIGYNANWPGILTEAMDEAPDFFVNTGDMVKDGDDDEQWRSLLEASEFGFARIPSILTMGNHDADDVTGDDAMYNQLFALPHNNPTDIEDYYSIDIGPIHFVSLSTQYSRPGSQQMIDTVAWLDADLTASTQPWTIIFFHKAIYTRGNHFSGEESDGAINAAFVPLFDTHDVDLVLNGHSHDYERYVPSTGLDRAFSGDGRSFPAGGGSTVRALAEVPDGGTGTTYIVTGGAGALTTDVLGFTCLDAACTYCTGFNINCEDEVFDNDQDGTVQYDGRHNYVVVDVQGGRLRVTARATDTGNTDGDEILDSFIMVSSDFPPDLCGSSDDVGADVGGDSGTDLGDGDVVDTDPVDDISADSAENDSASDDSGAGEDSAADDGSVDEDGGEDGSEDEDSQASGTAPDDGCDCSSSAQQPRSLVALLLLGAVVLRRRRG